MSLGRGLAALDEGRDLVVSYGDVLFNRYILQILDLPDEDFVIVADTDWQDSVNRDRAADYLRCSEPHSRAAFYHRVLLEDAGETLAPAQIHGEWMGFLRVSTAAVPRLLACVAALLEAPGGNACKLHHVLSALVGEGEAVRVVYTTGHWLDVDTVDDLVAAGGFGA